jgi:hypothetical protein
LVSLIALGLIGLNVYTAARYSDVKPLVVRIDEVGRAEAVAYDASRYQPQPPELRYFLTQFVVKHFGRIRATVQREYPDSLLFLEPGLADATIAQNDQSRSMESFLMNPSADEIEIVVQNVSLSELTTTPFKAAIKTGVIDQNMTIPFNTILGGQPAAVPLHTVGVSVNASPTGLDFGGIPWFSYSSPLALILTAGGNPVSSVRFTVREVVSFAK